MKLLNRSQCNLMVQIGLNSVRQIWFPLIRDLNLYQWDWDYSLGCDAVWCGTRKHFGGTGCFHLQGKVG
jgi:hypothetical protein